MTEKLNKRYFYGFVAAFILTAISFWVALSPTPSLSAKQGAISILAGIQSSIYLIYYLELGKEPFPKWNLISFFFMLFITVLVIGGSLWIMYNLNYNLMPRHD